MTTLTVGAGQQFTTLASAINASRDGDIVQVQAGTYSNDFAEVTHKITIQGVGGMAKLVATQAIPNGKAILITDTDVTLDHIELSGATVSSGNGAGIRYQGGNLTITNSYIHDNQDGILSASDPNGTISISNSEFSHNGSGTGQTHNIYVGGIKSLTIDNSYIHGAVVGHQVKSRAASTTITNSRIADGAGGNGSYDIDLPNGGAVLIKNNTIEKGPSAQNPNMIAYGEEGDIYAATDSLTVTGNTMLNDKSSSVNGVWNALGNVQASVSGNSTYHLGASQVLIGTGAVTNNAALATELAYSTASPVAASAPTTTSTGTIATTPTTTAPTSTTVPTTATSTGTTPTTPATTVSTGTTAPTTTGTTPTTTAPTSTTVPITTTSTGTTPTTPATTAPTGTTAPTTTGTTPTPATPTTTTAPPSSTPSGTTTPTSTTPTPVTTSTVKVTGGYYGTISNATVIESGSNQGVWVAVTGSNNVISMSGWDDTIFAHGSNNQVTVTAGTGYHILNVDSGSGNVVDGGGGTNKVTDYGTNNTIVLHKAGAGHDDLWGNYLSNGDLLDVRSALGATDWNHNATTVSSYITVAPANGGVDTNLLVSATAGGTGVAFATLHNSGALTEAALLTHLKMS